jgi:hypothetical protein
MIANSTISSNLLVVTRRQFYKDSNGLWQWRKFKNNKIVAVSIDGFSSRQAGVINARLRGYIGK